jgi:L-lactate utilization protein LutC
LKHVSTANIDTGPNAKLQKHNCMRLSWEQDVEEAKERASTNRTAENT